LEAVEREIRLEVANATLRDRVVSLEVRDRVRVRVRVRDRVLSLEV